jgi:hypothetical protein
MQRAGQGVPLMLGQELAGKTSAFIVGMNAENVNSVNLQGVGKSNIY